MLSLGFSFFVFCFFKHVIYWIIVGSVKVSNNVEINKWIITPNCLNFLCLQFRVISLYTNQFLLYILLSIIYRNNNILTSIFLFMTHISILILADLNFEDKLCSTSFCFSGRRNSFGTEFNGNHNFAFQRVFNKDAVVKTVGRDFSWHDRLKT